MERCSASPEIWEIQLPFHFLLIVLGKVWCYSSVYVGIRKHYHIFWWNIQTDIDTWTVVILISSKCLINEKDAYLIAVRFLGIYSIKMHIYTFVQGWGMYHYVHCIITDNSEKSEQLKFSCTNRLAKYIQYIIVILLNWPW